MSGGEVLPLPVQGLRPRADLLPWSPVVSLELHHRLCKLELCNWIPLVLFWSFCVEEGLHPCLLVGAGVFELHWHRLLQHGQGETEGVKHRKLFHKRRECFVNYRS